ncbi:hypothetical protein ILYODFUR_039096 [Ilyodon furcidens]|uniref:Uncharacterized protein n=1 Tax=Ilyodon furcidens TaxID=33524 RepID=A0ABV0SSV6_9TELE
MGGNIAGMQGQGIWSVLMGSWIKDTGANLLEAAEHLRLRWSFSIQEDNDPKQEARATMEWFKPAVIVFISRPKSS